MRKKKLVRTDFFMKWFRSRRVYMNLKKTKGMSPRSTVTVTLNIVT